MSGVTCSEIFEYSRRLKYPDENRLEKLIEKGYMIRTPVRVLPSVKSIYYLLTKCPKTTKIEYSSRGILVKYRGKLVTTITTYVPYVLDVLYDITKDKNCEQKIIINDFDFRLKLREKYSNVKFRLTDLVQRVASHGFYTYDKRHIILTCSQVRYIEKLLEEFQKDPKIREMLKR